MTLSIDPIPAEKDTATRETTRPPKSGPRSSPRRAALAWAALAAAFVAVTALAIATFTGGDDKVDTRLDPMAEQYEWQAHLEGQAETHGGADNVDVPAPRLDPMAEQSERQAHLDGQAETHGGDGGSENQGESNSTNSDPYDGEFLPGSRHVPTS